MQEENKPSKPLEKIPPELILANSVHEIRTPVQTIIGTLDLLSDTELSKEQQNYLRQIRLGAEVLLSLVDDILDFSKINSDKMPLEHRPFDIKNLTENAVHLISAEGFKKNLEIVCDIDYSIPDLVLGDSKRIQQILLNIVKNAIKFTKEGYVLVELSRKDEDYLMYRITDSGIGVPEKNREKIFESYFQGDPSISRKYGGTGLGLAICKGLVQMMNGEIGVERNPYGGSVFYFTFPFRTVKENQIPIYHIPVPANTKILVVDDSLLAAKSLEKKLKYLGIQNVATSSDAKESLLTLQYAAAMEEPFEIVFIDMHMPLFDGWNLAESIRNNPLLEKTRLFMLIPEGLMGNLAAEKIDEIFDGFIYKPVQIDSLENLFEKAFGEEDSRKLIQELENLKSIEKRISESEISEHGENRTASGLNQNQKDANPENQTRQNAEQNVQDQNANNAQDKQNAEQTSENPNPKSAEKNTQNKNGQNPQDEQNTKQNKNIETNEIPLKNLDTNDIQKKDGKTENKAKVLVAEDHPVNRKILAEFLRSLDAEVYEAENGKEALESIKKHPSVQIIFMDIQMPEIDGVEATVRLRKENYSGIIIACTANNDPENFAKYVKTGMNDVLVKPFKRNNVKILLEKWSTVINLPFGAEIAFLDSKLITNQELWDTDDFEDTISNDWNLGRQILYDFCEQTKNMISELESAVRKDDFENIHRIAHTIKGSSAAISANKLNYIGNLISQASKSHDKEEIIKQTENLRNEFETFLILSGKWKHLES